DKSAKQSDSRGLRVYLNQGDGSWKGEDVGSHGGLFGDHLQVADIDGDGRPDLLVASSVEARRHGVFLSGRDPRRRQEELAPLRRAYTPAVAAGDVDGDRRVEVAAAFTSHEPGDWYTGIDVFHRTRTGQWTRRLVWSEKATAGVWSLALGDVD